MLPPFRRLPLLQGPDAPSFDFGGNSLDDILPLCETMTWHVEDYILLCFVHRRQQNCRNTSSSTNLAQELLAWGRHNAASIVSPCTFACPRAIPIACTGITASIYNAHQSLSSASQCYARCCKQPTVSPTCTDFRANQNDRTAFAWFFQKGTFEHLHKTRSKTSLVIA